MRTETRLGTRGAAIGTLGFHPTEIASSGREGQVLPQRLGDPPWGGAVDRELVGSHLLKSRTNEAQGSLADDKKQLDLVFQCLFGSVM